MFNKKEEITHIQFEIFESKSENKENSKIFVSELSVNNLRSTRIHLLFRGRRTYVYLSVPSLFRSSRTILTFQPTWSVYESLKSTFCAISLIRSQLTHSVLHHAMLGVECASGTNIYALERKQQRSAQNERNRRIWFDSLPELRAFYFWELLWSEWYSNSVWI